ncbi:MAG: TolC family protein [Planctomycetes bacterium]|nr:TolC family protein [Planctomycetota bacterium]MCC7171204.1 TolC family protein [Planctomycetota bacterium]
MKVALLNNHAIRAQLQRLGVARADLVQAGLLANPVFSANAKFFDDAREIELDLTQSFVDLFFRPLRRSVAAALLQEREAEVKGAVLRIVFDVKRAFVRVRASQDVQELTAHVLKAADGSFQLMQALHVAGNVTDAQFTTEEAALGQAKLEHAKAVSEAIEAREPLNVLLGLWGDATAWRIEGRLAAFETADAPEHLERRAIEESLALAATKSRAQAAAQRAGLAIWQGIFGSGEVGVFAKNESEAGWGFGPGFSLPIPLFNRGQAQRAAAEAELDQALHDYTSEAVEIRSAARVFRERLLARSERAMYLRQIHLPVRARLVQETLQNYNAMQIGAFEVLLAKQQEIQAGREYVETLRDAHLARLDIEELIAGNLNPERLASEDSRESHTMRNSKNGDHP